MRTPYRLVFNKLVRKTLCLISEEPAILLNLGNLMPANIYLEDENQNNPRMFSRDVCGKRTL